MSTIMAEDYTHYKLASCPMDDGLNNNIPLHALETLDGYQLCLL